MDHRKFWAAASLFIFAGLSGSAQASGWGDTAAQVWVARSEALVAAASQPIYAAGSPDAGQQVIYVYPQSKLAILGRGEQPAEYKGRTEAAGQYVENLKKACSGLTGEHIKNGGRNMPTWAQTAQQRFCLSIDDLKHASFDEPSDKDRCKSTKSAAEYAAKAKRGEDPDAVVEAATRLAAAAEALNALPLVMVKRSLGGAAESSRTFSCK